MPAPVKISDRLRALARDEAKDAHRSITAQIEHWATLGRAVEVMVAYRDMLALKKTGQTLPIPAHVPREGVHELMMTMATADRDTVKARIRSAGTPVYTTDERYPGMIVQVQPDGTRTLGTLKGRLFVPAARRIAARRRSSTGSRSARTRA